MYKNKFRIKNPFQIAERDFILIDFKICIIHKNGEN